jgi:hypothetical protein
MAINCPNCSTQLKLSTKNRQTLAALPAGKKIKVQCNGCSRPFSIDRNSLTAVSTAANRQSSAAVRPPEPPLIDWLKDGTFEDREVVEDIPKALILFPEIPAKSIFVSAAEEFGYLVEQVRQPQEAIEKMRFVNYAAIFLHQEYEKVGIENGTVHHYMRQLNMARRRYMFYVLIGRQFQTLYDLQALAYSANLVVNDKHTEYISTLLRKAIPEYEMLFGPLMEEIRMAGK